MDRQAERDFALCQTHLKGFGIWKDEAFLSQPMTALRHLTHTNTLKQISDPWRVHSSCACIQKYLIYLLHDGQNEADTNSNENS